MTTDPGAASSSFEQGGLHGDHVEGMQPQKKPKGCFFWGCLTVLILLLLVGGCTGYFACQIYNVLMDISDDTPMDVPMIDVTPEELSALEERYAEFARQADQGGGGELALSADDLNRRISGSNGELQGIFWVRIEGSRVFLDASIPLSEFGMGFDGRYINGTVGTGITMKDGKVDIVLESLETPKGHELTKEELDQISQALSADARTRQRIDDIFGDAARKAKDLEIKDGKLIFRN